MTSHLHRIAIVFPADAKELGQTRVGNTRLAATAQAFVNAGAEAISAPFCDDIADEIEERLSAVDLVLVWYNPFEAGRDRTRLNAMLRTVAARGVKVSAHPDVIDQIGTKDVLWNTRHMAWGTDTRRYASADAMRSALPALLSQGSRVLKQMRGQSGEGVWRVSWADEAQEQLAVRHAKRGCVEQRVSMDEFLALMSPYFNQGTIGGGAMIDQPYQERLREGMIRCYVVGGQVAGFGEQPINALYPAPINTFDSSGLPSTAAPEPGPRLYFPADRPDFQALKRLLEGEWIAQLCETLAIKPQDLPILWDIDFIRGEKTIRGEDTYVLCEINTSSVYPFPPSALQPLVELSLSRCASNA